MNGGGFFKDSDRCLFCLFSHIYTADLQYLYHFPPMFLYSESPSTMCSIA